MSKWVNRYFSTNMLMPRIEHYARPVLFSPFYVLDFNQIFISPRSVRNALRGSRFPGS